MSSKTETSVFEAFAGTAFAGRAAAWRRLVPPHFLNARRRCLWLLALLTGIVSLAFGQESPTPEGSPTGSPALTPEASPSLSISPSPSPPPPPSASPTTTIAPTAGPSPVRNVRISFLPPPLEGKISLGIYDQSGQLVRILHQEADLDEFTIGADALSTRWDGKDNDGKDLAAGTYHARGYLVGRLKLETGGTAPTPDLNAATSVPIKLMANPLAKDERPVVNLAVGFDDENSFLKTGDGLPLFTITTGQKLIRAGITKNGEKSVDVWQDDGSAIEQFRISNVDRMMAFDCGDFQLR